MKIPPLALLRPCRTATLRGLSLVELMVGLSVGLVITAAAAAMFLNQLREQQALRAEVQLQQELRAVTEIIRQDLRRAGFDNQAHSLLWQTSDPKGLIDRTPGWQLTRGNGKPGQGDEVRFHYAKLRSDNRSINERIQRGFKLDGAQMRYLVGGQWQPLTDPQMSEVLCFEARLSEQTLPTDGLCRCADASPCTLKWTVQWLDIQLKARHRRWPEIVRASRIQTLVRNDALAGACP